MNLCAGGEVGSFLGEAAKEALGVVKVSMFLVGVSKTSSTGC